MGIGSIAICGLHHDNVSHVSHPTTVHTVVSRRLLLSWACMLALQVV